MDGHDIVEQLKKGEVDLGVSLIFIGFFFASNGIVQTSIMAVQFEGGVVIGADTRTSVGTYVVRLPPVDYLLVLAYEISASHHESLIN